MIYLHFLDRPIGSYPKNNPWNGAGNKRKKTNLNLINGVKKNQTKKNLSGEKKRIKRADIPGKPLKCSVYVYVVLVTKP